MLPRKRTLSPATEALLTASDEDRIQAIDQNKFLVYGKALELLKEMDELLDHPKTYRMPNLLIVARSNNGKTEILRKFLDRHPVEERPDMDCTYAPVVYVQCPAGPTEHVFLNAALSKLGVPLLPSASADRKLLQLIDVLKALNTKVLLIDELNSLLAGGGLRQRYFLNLLKYLSNELQLSIVAAGTQEALHAIRTDEQISNRFPVRVLPRWQMGADFKQLLRTFESTLPLRQPSRLDSEAIAGKLYGYSEGLIGELARTIKNAAKHAIATGAEQITEDIINSCPNSLRRAQDLEAI